MNQALHNLPLIGRIELNELVERRANAGIDGDVQENGLARTPISVLLCLGVPGGGGLC